MSARPPEVSTKPVSGRASASRVSASATWPVSVGSTRRNFRRAGTDPNRSRTSTVVPRGWPTSRACTRRPWCTSTSVPLGEVSSRVRRRSWETPAIAGRASPRKPWVAIALRSESTCSFDVAWRSSARTASSGVMPSPLSRTRMSCLPPASISTVTVDAPASRAFSTSSFTTEAGRSTASPAAILLTRSSGSRWMTAIGARAISIPCGGTTRAGQRRRTASTRGRGSSRTSSAARACARSSCRTRRR